MLNDTLSNVLDIVDNKIDWADFALWFIKKKHDIDLHTVTAYCSIYKYISNPCIFVCNRNSTFYFIFQENRTPLFRCTVYVNNNALYRFIDCTDWHLPCRLCLHLIPLDLSCPNTSNPVLLAPFRISMFLSLHPFEHCHGYSIHRDGYIVYVNNTKPCSSHYSIFFCVYREYCGKYVESIVTCFPSPHPPTPTSTPHPTSYWFMHYQLTYTWKLFMYSYDSLMAKFLCMWKGLGRREW